MSPRGGSPRRATTFSTSSVAGRAQVVAELVDRAADAGEMRRHGQLKLAVHAGDDFQRQFLRRAAGAVRARDEAGPELDQPRDVLKEIGDSLRRLRRKQLERQAELAGPVGGGQASWEFVLERWAVHVSVYRTARTERPPGNVSYLLPLASWQSWRSLTGVRASSNAVGQPRRRHNRQI